MGSIGFHSRQLDLILRTVFLKLELARVSCSPMPLSEEVCARRERSEGFHLTTLHESVPLKGS
jgi:hypothetical protein